MFDNIFQFDVLSCGKMELFQLQLEAKVEIPHIPLKNWSLKSSVVCLHLVHVSGGHNAPVLYWLPVLDQISFNI